MCVRDDKMDKWVEKIKKCQDTRDRNKLVQKLVDYAQQKNLNFEVHASTHISLAWKEFYTEIEETEANQLYPMVSTLFVCPFFN